MTTRFFRFTIETTTDYFLEWLKNRIEEYSSIQFPVGEPETNERISLGRLFTSPRYGTVEVIMPGPEHLKAYLGTYNFEVVGTKSQKGNSQALVYPVIRGSIGATSPSWIEIRGECKDYVVNYVLLLINQAREVFPGIRELKPAGARQEESITWREQEKDKSIKVYEQYHCAIRVKW